MPQIFYIIRLLEDFVYILYKIVILDDFTNIDFLCL